MGAAGAAPGGRDGKGDDIGGALGSGDVLPADDTRAPTLRAASAERSAEAVGCSVATSDGELPDEPEGGRDPRPDGDAEVLPVALPVEEPERETLVLPLGDCEGTCGSDGRARVDAVRAPDVVAVELAVAVSARLPALDADAAGGADAVLIGLALAPTLFVAADVVEACGVADVGALTTAVPLSV